MRCPLPPLPLLPVSDQPLREDDDVRPRQLRSAAAADEAKGGDVLQAMVGHGGGLRAHHHARTRSENKWGN